MASLFLEPLFSSYTMSFYHPEANNGPLLSRQMHRWRAQERRDRQMDLLKAKADTWDGRTLHLEDLENAARQTLEAANALLAAHPEDKWLLSTR
jgi:hypothetical protein